MEQDQSQRSGAEEPSVGLGLSQDEIVREMGKMGVTLPLEAWARIPTLPLAAASGEAFERVKEQARARNRRLKLALDGPTESLNSAIRESGPPLRRLLEGSGAFSTAPVKVAADAEPQDASIGRRYTREEARMIFLWATSFLLESLGAAMEAGATAKLKSGVGNVLSDSESALEDDPGPIPQVLCQNCYPNYQRCMAAPRPNPTLCMSQYSYCTTHCT